MIKTCQIVLVGHNWQKLVLSIDKEVFNKLIFIVEKETLPGTHKAMETVEKLLLEYKSRKVDVERCELSFSVPSKPVAELTHLIYQLKLQDYNRILLNVSGGLRYVVIWMFIVASITKSSVIHGDFIYEGDLEVGIYKNDELNTMKIDSLTSKQFEFLQLFFPKFDNLHEFFDAEIYFNQNSLFTEVKTYESIEDVKASLIKYRGEPLTRGAINGYILKLNRISALDLIPDSENRKKITISYTGIAFFLKEAYKLLKK